MSHGYGPGHTPSSPLPAPVVPRARGQVFIQISTRPMEDGVAGGGGSASPGKAAQGKGKGKEGGADGEKDVSRAFHRRCFLECLVRISGMRYVETGEVASVAAALEKLLTEKLAPTLRSQLGHSSNVYGNAFRKRNSYTWGASKLLTEHLETLRAVYEAYSTPFADKKETIESLLPNRLLSLDEWIRLVKDFQLLDPAFTVRVHGTREPPSLTPLVSLAASSPRVITESPPFPCSHGARARVQVREASLAFMWSRLEVIDERTRQSRYRRYSLSLEDFFEALIRLAMMKALPTDMELVEAGCEDVSSFFAQLSKQKGAYEAWAAQHAWDVDWEDDLYEPKQVCSRAFEFALELLEHAVVTSEGGVADGSALTRKRVERFRREQKSGK